MKRIFAVLLIVSLTIAAPCTIGAANDVNAVNEKAALVLEKLEIIDANANSAVDQSLTRAEMCMYLIRMLNISGAVDENRKSTYFEDVPLNHWALGYINLSYKLELINGDDDRFSPDEEVTLAEAIKMTVSALGYRVVAEAGGGYPAGYINVARQNKMLDKIASDYYAPIAQRDLFMLIYQSLEVPILEQITFGDILKFETSGDAPITLLSIRDIKKSKGTITATEFTGLTPYSKTAPKNSVFVGQEAYEVSDKTIYDSLACRVEFYYEESDDKKIMLCAFANGEDKEVIDADSILGNHADFSETELYYEIDGKTIKKEIAPGAIVIYNGKAVDMKLEYLKPDAGYITLIDGKQSGKYDIVLVKEYRSFVIDSVVKTDRKVYFEHGVLNGRPFIDFSDPDISFRILSADGKEELDWSLLSAKDAISVCASKDNRMVEVNLLDKKAQGTVSEISYTDNEISNVMIGDKTYELQKGYYLNGISTVRVGDRVELYLDICNKVFRINGNMEIKNYAFPMGIDEGNGIDDTLQLKLLTKDSAIKVYKTAEKVRFFIGNTPLGKYDGQQVKEALCQNGELKKDLIIFELNSDGEISEITVSLDTPSDDDSSFSKDRILDGAVDCYYAYGRLDDIMISDDTLVFAPALQDNGTYNEKLATVTNRNFFSSSNNAVKFNMIIYNIDQSGTAGAILTLDTASKGLQQEEWDVVAVDKVIKTVDEENNEAYKLTGMQNGNKLSWMIAEDAISTKLVAGDTDEEIFRLKKGDTLIFETNLNGEISVFQVLYRNGQQADGWIHAFGAGYGNSKATSMQVYSGVAEYLSDKVLKLRSSTGTVPFTVEGDFLVYIYNSQSNKLSLADKGDIIQNQTKLVVYGNRNSVVLAVIYQ